MKKVIALVLIAFVSMSAMAQQMDLRRKINVTGNSEIEITPDEIYVSISLKEYFKDNNNKKKVEITELETQLYNAIVKAGIAKENLTISNLNSWNYNYEKKKNTDFLASKQYRLKLSDLYKFNLIMDGIDAKGVQNTYIESYSYSKIESLKKEMRIKALADAKDKASYLVTSVGSKLGDVLEIQEIGNGNGGYDQPMYRMNVMAVSKTSADAEMAPEIDSKKIKLTFTVNAVFEIK